MAATRTRSARARARRHGARGEWRASEIEPVGKRDAAPAAPKPPQRVAASVAMQRAENMAKTEARDPSVQVPRSEPVEVVDAIERAASSKPKSKRELQAHLDEWDKHATSLAPRNLTDCGEAGVSGHVIHNQLRAEPQSLPVKFFKQASYRDARANGETGSRASQVESSDVNPGLRNGSHVPQPGEMKPADDHNTASPRGPDVPLGEFGQLRRSHTAPDVETMGERESIKGTPGAPARKRTGLSHHVTYKVVVPEGQAVGNIGTVSKKETLSSVVLPQISKFRPLKTRKKKTKKGVVYKGHPSWSIVLAIQFGLKHTSDLIEQQLRGKEIVIEERAFDDRLIFYFDAGGKNGRAKRKDISDHTRWECHAPFVYRKLREELGYSEEEFLSSTCVDSKLRELQTPGKSGALFYITEDEEFFLKTLTTSEDETLNFILPSYFAHLQKYPDTFLTKFLANFGMKTRSGRHIRLIAMSSVFHANLYIDEKYDLKGSTKGRLASEKDRRSDNVILKDCDLKEPLFFDPQVLERIMLLLDVDSLLLEENNIMDYSLLMGLSEILPEDNHLYDAVYGPNEQDAPWFVAYQNDAQGVMRKFRVSMGIIDILQTFVPRKQAEYVWKMATSCRPGTISVNPPGLYRRRFVEFFRSKFLPITPAILEKSLLTIVEKSGLESGASAGVPSKEGPADDQQEGVGDQLASAAATGVAAVTAT
ncbi:putative phosphatidylinositol phosphate kinase [Porphyridium purpureum]|uniref:Putative phosphatidylinositol phosphate kinase n=1 Tax=Porphyridium purpureum TaxID=35688 RepID=A0A5J4Z7J8_PORPP|nr:putative phosphatidylinositol phosphate kinase [Porphyridium purpureum]|eukprot:POR7660..scf295_1